MRRFFCLLSLMLACLLLLAGCSPSPSVSLPASVPSANSLPESSASGAEIALITTEERLASDFGQTVWTAISHFGGEKGITCGSYKTEADSPEAAQATLEMAVKGGAKLVITMDETVTTALAGQQARNVDVSFVFLDAAEPLALWGNAVSVVFSPEQAGWVAGYLAAGESEGTLGLASTVHYTSQLYALGFLLGAETAMADRAEDAAEPARLDIVLAEVEVSTIAAMRGQIEEIYADGADLIFAADEAITHATLTSAQQTGNTMMGVGLTLANAWDNALASVQQHPKSLLTTLLDAWVSGSFPGGNQINGNVADGDVVLQTEPFRFKRIPSRYVNQALQHFESGMLGLRLAYQLKPDNTGTLPAPGALELPHLTLRAPGDVQPGEESPSETAVSGSPAAESEMPPDSSIAATSDDSSPASAG